MLANQNSKYRWTAISADSVFVVGRCPKEKFGKLKK
jgi:hypothetical protein